MLALVRGIITRYNYSSRERNSIMTKSNDEIQKEMKELRSDFCVYSFLIILTIAGFCLRNMIPWSWLKAIINFLFIGSVFELGRSIDKYLKLRKQLE